MFNRTAGRFEGWKAALSVAAIAAGLALSDMAASGTTYTVDGPGDVVGVWQWVMQGEGESRDVSGPFFDIRRAADGELKAIITVRSGRDVARADISVEGGQVCVITADGASFSGELSEDGLRIQGVLHYEGESSSAMLKRVERRKMRGAAGRKAYAAT